MYMERMPEPIDVLVIRNTFEEDVLNNIINELSSITQKDSGSGVWLNEFYSNVDESVLHDSIMNSYFTQEVSMGLSEVNPILGLYNNVNGHSVQIKKFGHRQSSMLHYDAAAFTAMSFFYKDPRDFTGGNVTIQVGSDIAYEHNVENNMTIIFPSSYYVGISEVRADDKENGTSGLYVVNTFMFIQAN